MSEADIQRIVAFATDPANKCTNDEQAQMVAEIRRQTQRAEKAEAERDALKVSSEERAKRSWDDYHALHQVNVSILKERDALRARVAELEGEKGSE